ncbi:MAG TPA: hypothetical protein VF585_01505 [Chthoniobacterales bacterium]|jgi:hypothetical protein
MTKAEFIQQHRALQREGYAVGNTWLGLFFGSLICIAVFSTQLESLSQGFRIIFFAAVLIILLVLFSYPLWVFAASLTSGSTAIPAINRSLESVLRWLLLRVIADIAALSSFQMIPRHQLQMITPPNQPLNLRSREPLRATVKMYRYMPPKSSIWGHSLRKMAPERQQRLFDAFLDRAVAEQRFKSAKRA